MLQALFHAWERRLASTTKDRIVRPFEWGLDWMPGDAGVASPPAGLVGEWVTQVMADTDAFYTPAPTTEYALRAAPDEGEQWLTFPSAIETPHPANNTVHCRIFHARENPDRAHRAAVVVLPQWNSDAEGHVALCRLLNRFKLSALRLSMPYHDARMPPDLKRADYIVSANVGRTAQVCRQAVLDARRAIAWLHAQGYTSIGILGTSLGSCLSMLTTAHEPLIKAAALNHISPYFADVVWDGLSTMHVRETLEGNVTLDELRRMWLPISPLPYLDRVRGRRILLVYALYDLTFPVHLSRNLVRAFRDQRIDHRLMVLPCGHYSTGVSPFKWVDGLTLCRFLSRRL